MASLAFDLQQATTAPTERETPYEETVTDRCLAPILIALRRGYCQAVFEDLARSSPEELAKIIRENRASDTRLTYAAEILGRDVDTPAVAGLLRQIVQTHPSPLVREGAVLGLSHHLQRLGIRDAVRRAFTDDPSPGVRRAAAEALED